MNDDEPIEIILPGNGTFLRCLTPGCSVLFAVGEDDDGLECPECEHSFLVHREHVEHPVTWYLEAL
jgi:hypothetical protein